MHIENYGIYGDLVKNGKITIFTKDLTDDNIDQHFAWIINILKDGIERKEIQRLKIHVVFTNKVELTLFIIDYMFNLMFWSMVCATGVKISSEYFYDSITEPITKSTITNYINSKIVRPNVKTIDMIRMNQTIDRAIGKFRDLTNFQMYLANTVNLEDTIDMMNKHPEFNDTIHFNIDGILMEDVKDEGMKAANKQIDYIKNSDHCLRDSFVAGEGINVKQFKEVAVNIGTKPNGMGGVFPHPVKGSFTNGGLQNVEELIVESSIGRIAQILQKQNVGESGAFARNLGLNNLDSELHEDPNYSCDTKNFEEITIENKDMLDELDMRYYRFKPNGVEYCVDCNKDKKLIGQKILLRSPITCASAARGQGICYKCYGNLAYVNRNINIGQIASEVLSSIYTQILLSAKHLLESAIVKMAWSKGFYEMFNVEYNQIVLKDEFNYKGYTMIIEDVFEDEDEELDDGLQQYILGFDIVTPEGETFPIKASLSENDYESIFLHQEIIDYMDHVGSNDDGVYELQMDKMRDLSALFVIDVQNEELSKTMKSIKNIINNKKSTKTYDRNGILEAFIKTNLSGGIKINSVHFEVLLMNQIRDAYDILELPDWSHPNEEYQILTLAEALTNNRSIGVRLQASKIARAITHHSNRKLHAASKMDLFYMEKPQDFMTNKDFTTSYNVRNTQKKIISPIYFSNGEGKQSK